MSKEKKGKQEDVSPLTIIVTNLAVFFALAVMSLLSLVSTPVILFPVLLVLVFGILSIVFVANKLKSKQLTKRSNFLIAAGILTIFAACYCFVVGFIEIILSAAWSSFGIHINYELLMRGMLGIAAFVFGLTAGILVLKRRFLPIVAGGVTIALISSLLTWSIPGLRTIAFLFLVVPVLIPIIISIIIIGASRREFSD